MDLTIIRGDDEFIDLTLATASGTAVDLTDVDLWFTAKESQYDTDQAAVLFKTTPSQIVVTSPPTSGLAVVEIPGSETKLIRSRYLSVPLYWDVQLKDGNGDIQTVATGTITITPDVTHAT